MPCASTSALTGTKKGCDHGAMRGLHGARCGKARSVMPHARGYGRGKEITTIEGLAGAADGRLHPVQQAFIDHDAFQCGYCTPGQIMSGAACCKQARPALRLNSRVHERQPLPLRGVSQYCRRNPGREVAMEKSVMRPFNYRRLLQPRHFGPAERLPRDAVHRGWHDALGPDETRCYATQSGSSTWLLSHRQTSATLKLPTAALTGGLGAYGRCR